MQITIGFTKSRHIRPRYIPAVDGYRPGAEQEEVVIDLPDEHFGDQEPDHIVEAVFRALAQTREQAQGDVDVRIAFDAIAATGAQNLRTMLPGDTIAGAKWRMACTRAGWELV